MSDTGSKTFEENIRDYAPNMYRLALAMLHNRQDAEDAVSEAVLKAYEKRRSLRDKNRFKQWIMQITANEARKIYGKNKRITPVEDMEEYMPVFREERFREEGQGLWEMVMQLEEVHREVIILYFYERFSIKEIGAVLHIPEGTVKSRLSRGKKVLKEMLES